MNGYITFWSKEYIRQIEKNKDKGPFCVVYGSRHTRMPSISSLHIGDIIYPVAIKNKTLCVMARLPIDKIEPAFEYIMRETGQYYSALIPDGILMKSEGPFGEFNIFAGGCGYTDKITLPSNIHTIINEESLVPIPHHFHQEPITCCAKLAASGSNGSDIYPRLIPLELIPSLRFGKSKATEKALKLDKNGYLTSTSLSGFVRRMSKDTFEIFENIFKDENS